MARIMQDLVGMLVTIKLFTVAGASVESMGQAVWYISGLIVVMFVLGGVLEVVFLAITLPFRLLAAPFRI